MARGEGEPGLIERADPGLGVLTGKIEFELLSIFAKTAQITGNDIAGGLEQAG